MDVRFIDPHQAVLTESGYGLDAIGSLRDVDLKRKGIETDAVYRARLIAKLHGEPVPLAFLNGQPIYVDDILYGLDGTKFKASTTGHRDYPMAMIDLASVRENTWTQWLTDTHWKGQQVLFWSPDDIPAPDDRTLHFRLKMQIEAKAKRKEKQARSGVRRR